MGLEPMGFGKLNQNILWIDPLDYSSVLEKVVFFYIIVDLMYLCIIFLFALCQCPYGNFAEKYF